MNINNAELKSEIMAKLEEVLHQLIKKKPSKRVDQPNKPYKLGKSIFTLHHQTDLTSVVGDKGGDVTDIVMMDDGRLVMCLPVQWRLLVCNTDGSQVDSLPVQRRLLICNTDGSQVDSIHVQGTPYSVTAVNNSTVAVTLLRSKCVIEMYDINNKLKLKSISLLGMWWGSGITTINNKLVVHGYNTLLIIDHQTGEVVQTIKIDCHPVRLHGTGDRVFYSDHYNHNNNKLYWYSYSDDRHHSLTLPSHPRRMTTLQDSSLYVGCEDGSVQHVSSDGKQYKPVKTEGLKSLGNYHDYGCFYYNCKQRKLVNGVLSSNVNINIFHEISSK
ncbi:uncharacterized protein LOC134695603 [Mytilus trossulus]|uniref:uncharacterized protein LOC134695603 n=1 Tax=Mytilus trossulus TaxID=6551 RepID=UPI0030050D74